MSKSRIRTAHNGLDSSKKKKSLRALSLEYGYNLDDLKEYQKQASRIRNLVLKVQKKMGVWGPAAVKPGTVNELAGRVAKDFFKEEARRMKAMSGDDVHDVLMYKMDIYFDNMIAGAESGAFWEEAEELKEILANMTPTEKLRLYMNDKMSGTGVSRFFSYVYRNDGVELDVSMAEFMQYMRKFKK